MLPEKLHIEQIQRFHNLLKSIDAKIEAEPDENKKGELARQWYQLSKVWVEIDDFIEFKLKTKLDNIEG